MSTTEVMLIIWQPCCERAGGMKVVTVANCADEVMAEADSVGVELI